MIKGIVCTLALGATLLCSLPAKAQMYQQAPFGMQPGPSLQERNRQFQEELDRQRQIQQQQQMLQEMQRQNELLERMQRAQECRARGLAVCF